MSNLTWFFRSPRSAPCPGETLSPLYLLRRDIDTCFGSDPNTGVLLQPIDKLSGAPINCQALWPGTMAILAGIDLLGKFLVGTDQTRGPGSVTVGVRYKDFCKRYLGLSEPDANLVYQLRNSMLHSFGLYAEEIDSQGKVKATYNFILSLGSDAVVQHLKDDYYQVDMQRLRELFDQAVAQYEVDLKDAKDINDKFNVMLPKVKPISYRVKVGFPFP
ncbi:MAG: hypothetical protein HY879_19405 [Deltaproteobacteria bacterium]|nr:hypothetical protein [Deltaproteobacteria bacterium]